MGCTRKPDPGEGPVSDDIVRQTGVVRRERAAGTSGCRDVGRGTFVVSNRSESAGDGILAPITSGEFTRYLPGIRLMKDDRQEGAAVAFAAAKSGKHVKNSAG
jgi:hypothetical protein